MVLDGWHGAAFVALAAAVELAAFTKLALSFYKQGQTKQWIWNTLRTLRVLKSVLFQPSSRKDRRKGKPSSSAPAEEPDQRTLTGQTFDPAFLPYKVLGSNAPTTSSQQAISKWMLKLKLSYELRSQLQQNTCTEAELEVLHQRVADFGFPERELMEAKHLELLKIVLAVCALAA